MSSGGPSLFKIRSDILSTVKFGAHALKLGKLMRPFSSIALMIRLRSGPFEPSVNVSSTEDVPIGCSIQSSIVTSSFHAAADKNKLLQLGSVQDVVITRVERLYGDGRHGSSIHSFSSSLPIHLHFWCFRFQQANMIQPLVLAAHDDSTVIFPWYNQVMWLGIFQYEATSFAGSPVIRTYMSVPMMG